MATEHNDGTPRTILVPIGRSDAASAALDLALLPSLNRRDRPQLAVVDVTADPMRFDAALVSDLRRAKERLVDEVVATAADHDADVTGAVRRRTARPERSSTTPTSGISKRSFSGRSGRSGS